MPVQQFSWLAHAADRFNAAQQAIGEVVAQLESQGAGGATAEMVEIEHFAGGFCQETVGGAVYWSSNTGAYFIDKRILDRHRQLGAHGSSLGYPLTHNAFGPDGVGMFNRFEHGNIYWHPDIGPKLVYSTILTKYIDIGGPSSFLGYPTSDETDFPNGGRANSFQNGGIYWWSDTGAIELGDVAVNYTGLFCFEETDESSAADEPYVIATISAPGVEPVIKQSRIYESVDRGFPRPDLMELYRGNPYGINIGTAVMEHDLGDPEKYKEQIKDAVFAAHAAGTAALALIPVAGIFIAAAAGPGLGAFMGDIASAINDLLGTGEDEIGSSTVTLTGRDMVLLAARTDHSEFHGIRYKVETPLISGSGGSYKVYYDLVPA